MDNPVENTHTPPSAYWLTDVLLDSAIVDTDDGAKTLTRRVSVKIDDGVIAAIVDGAPGDDDATRRVDGADLLMLPSLRDTHLHLDKTFYGGPWRAPVPGRYWLAEEERLLPEMSEQIPLRSNAILDLVGSNGTTDVVAHCNVDHVVGTRNVERLLEVVRQRDDVSVEVVAYPQHGLQAGRVTALLSEALRLGASSVGGLDPALVEGDIEAALDATFDLAVEHGVDVDFHLHDAGTLGLFEIGRVIDRTESAGWQGRVHLSAAGSLAHAPAGTVRSLAERLAAAGVSIGATVSPGVAPLPFRALDDAGVRVSLGSDSITDILTPFGQGDILLQVWMLAQQLGWSDERRLARSLLFGAGERARWAEDGHRDWPHVGDAADFVLVPASCTAEAVARLARRERVFRQGRQVFPMAEGSAS